MDSTGHAEFLRYWERVHERTARVVALVPPSALEWSYQPGKFTCGDLIRHLAAIERTMFAENAAGRPSRYSGHGRELADGYPAVMDFYRRMHEETVAIVAALAPADLLRRCRTPGGAELPVWKWLRAMLEHQIHHRGQLYLYLSMLGVPAPPLYGLTSEEVQRASAPAPS